MPFYLVLFRKTFYQQFQYRMASLINNFGSLVFATMYLAIWQGTLGDHRQVAGLDSLDMARYIAFAQSLLFLTTFLPRGFGISDAVRTGAIAMDLLRPSNFFVYHLAQCFGYQIYNLLFRSLPVFLIFWWAFGLPPFHWATLPLLLFSVLIAMYLGFLLQYFVGIAAFWTNSIRWAFIVQYTLIMTFSGNFVPIPAMPGWMATFGAYSPFAGLHYYPIMTYLGHPSSEGVWVPLLWCGLLTAAALWLTKRARAKMEVQGG